MKIRIMHHWIPRFELFGLSVVFYYIAYFRIDDNIAKGAVFASIFAMFMAWFFASKRKTLIELLEKGK